MARGSPGHPVAWSCSTVFFAFAVMWPPLCSSVFSKDPDHWILASILNFQDYFISRSLTNYLCPNPVSKSGHTLRFWVDTHLREVFIQPIKEVQCPGSSQHLLQTLPTLPSPPLQDAPVTGSFAPPLCSPMDPPDMPPCPPRPPGSLTAP